LNALVHLVDFERNVGSGIPAGFGKPDHQVDVRLEEAQAVGRLHEVRIPRAAPFVHAKLILMGIASGPPNARSMSCVNVASRTASDADGAIRSSHSSDFKRCVLL
jgi:hypothetical protein